MAKSNGFFSLRRGSTKSLTFSVLDGKQITKDRVSSVKNPKSQKQQYQRAIMATVMAAYSAMQSIVDHSFQGKSKGSANQREFMSRNLNKMRAALITYFDTNPTVSKQNFVSVAPKVPTCLPCAWDISRGSLENSSFLKYEDSDHRLTIPFYLVSNAFEQTPDGWSANAGALADALGIYEGLQRTYLCITMDTGTPIYQKYDEEGAGYANYNFGFARFIVGKFDRSKVYEAPQDRADIIREFVGDITDSRSSVSFRNIDFVLDGTNVFYTDAEVALASAGFDESLTYAIGEITSVVDEDLRSNSVMQPRNWTDSKLLGLTYEYIWDAWRTVDPLGESEKYLEGGNV